VDGPDLDYVKSVTYHLHPTFANPEFKVDRTVSNSNCELTIWTWGIFTVHVEVEDKRGGTYTIDHYLTYNRLLDETGITFQQM
jgi:transcription initiation factor IIF auxiliary subunit